MASELADPLWRLQNLYKCRAEGSGIALAFKPRPEQLTIFKDLLDRPKVPVYIIKSRRLGISTAVDTFQADQAAFNQGFRGVIIDQKQDDATKKMVEIVRFAMDSLGPRILSGFTFDKRNDSELRLRFAGEEEAKDSVIYATTGTRGGDCSMLHVSEWGPISATDPVRSQEIRTGAFPSARLGRRVVETTWYGGKSGDLWDLVKPIMDSDPNAEGVVYFFPWHSDPEAIRIEGQTTAEIEDYFKDLAGKLSKSFSREQKLWYASKKLEQGMFVKREYPSTLDEALSVPMAGTIYGDLIDQLREKKRISDFPAEKDFPGYTFWDCGISDFGAVWLIQLVGRDILILDYISSTGQPAAFYAKWVIEAERRHGIKIVNNFQPHDANAREKGTGKTFRDHSMDAGLSKVTIVPRTPDLWVSINNTRKLIPRAYIHSKNCTQAFSVSGRTIPSGLDCLDYYHRKEVAGIAGTIMEEPVHDQYSHGASALRTFGEAFELGMIEGTSFVARENRIKPVTVLRGPSPDSYSISVSTNPKRPWRGAVLR